MYSYAASTTEIAVRLGLATSTGRPHHRLVSSVISDIGAKPLEMIGNIGFYGESVIKMIRLWFLEEVGINFDSSVKVGRRKFVVRYLPEDEGFDLSRPDIEIVA